MNWSVPAAIKWIRALEFLAELGIEELCVFEGRKRRLEPLGRATTAETEAS